MAEPAHHYWYADDTTRAALQRQTSRIVLLGGYSGYNNFGDILQLKGAIRWHRRHTGREPVVVCDARAVPDAQFVSRLRECFGVEEVLFYSPHRLDSELALSEWRDAPHLEHLHVYGGGFLNAMWGPLFVSLIEATIERFGVGHYVLSGQQASEEIGDVLHDHFRRYRPLLVGARDHESLGVLRSSGAEATYSFDDASEALQEFACRQPPDPAPADLLLHMNLSGYTRQGDFESAAHQLVERLDRLSRHIREKAGNHLPEVVLLQSYTDRRADVVDTLNSAQALADCFPFASYRVVDLADLALRVRDPDTARLPLPVAPIAMVGSYHTALLCGVLSVPCFLSAENDYYRQKQRGLGLRSRDLARFLQFPERIDLTAAMTARKPWLDRLAEAYRQPPTMRVPTLPVAYDVDGSAESSHPCPTRMPEVDIVAIQRELAAVRVALAERETELEDTRVELASTRDALADELSAVRMMLEERSAKATALSETLARVRDTFQARTREHAQQVAALERSLGDRDAEVRRLVVELETIRAQLAYMRDSVSWRITTPLRAVRRRLQAMER